jgi:membrane protein involved in colicin uptake
VGQVKNARKILADAEAELIAQGADKYGAKCAARLNNPEAAAIEKRAQEITAERRAREAEEARAEAALQKAMQEAKAASEREAAEKRDNQIAKLDKYLDLPLLSPSTYGGTGQLSYAQEILKLEREKGRSDEEIARLHPRIVEVFEKHAEYNRQKSRGISR